MMIAVIVAAVFLRLIIAIVQVQTEPDISTLCHLGQFRDDGSYFVYGHATTPRIYWAKIWRRFLGRPWPGGFACPCREDQEKEFGRPVIHLEMNNGMKVLDDRMDELNRQIPKRQKASPNGTSPSDKPEI